MIWVELMLRQEEWWYAVAGFEGLSAVTLRRISAFR